jgi:5'-3' exonuclease
VLLVTAQEAERFFLTQVLTGDKTDGYCGVPGVGPVKAARILDSVFAERDPWQTVVDTFTKAGLSADVALDTARCAWILRKGDYDFDTGEITMWTPDRLLT